MAVIGETRRSNSRGSEVDSPDKSNSRDGDTNKTNFIVWLREEFDETYREESLLGILGVSGSRLNLSPHLN